MASDGVRCHLRVLGNLLQNLLRLPCDQWHPQVSVIAIISYTLQSLYSSPSVFALQDKIKEGLECQAGEGRNEIEGETEWNNSSVLLVLTFGRSQTVSASPLEEMTGRY